MVGHVACMFYYLAFVLFSFSVSRYLALTLNSASSRLNKTAETGNRQPSIQAEPDTYRVRGT